MGGPDTLYVHRGGPALADEVELRDELVGPPGDDGLAGGVARRVIVETALGARLRVRAGPHRDVHGVDGRRCFAPGKRMTGEQFPQSFGVDAPSPECSVEASPAATMRRLEAQMNRRRDDAIRGEDGIGELEEGVSLLRWRHSW